MSQIPFPVPLFFGADGDALEDGYIYVGEAGQTARENQIVVYWDAGLTQTAAQPIRTTAGYPAYQGRPSGLYIAEAACSVTVLDRYQQSVLVDAPVDTTGGGNSASGYSLESRSVAVDTEIPSSVDIVTTGGYYAAGDGGGSQFARVTGPLSGTANFQSADGAWWEIRPQGNTIYPEQWGAHGDGLTSDSAAINAAIVYADANGFILGLYGKVYVCSTTIDFKEVTVQGVSCKWQQTDATIFRANTTGILLSKGGMHFSDLVFDGNNKALWGHMTAFSARMSYTNIEIMKCTEYGLVLNRAQNATFDNVYVKYNYIGFVLANGVQNCCFTGCSGSIERAPDGTSTASANSRVMLFLINTSNPHSFGLSTSVTTGGNSNNSWHGGIFECFNSVSDYVLETSNPSAYSSVCANNNAFFRTNFVAGSGSLFLFDSTIDDPTGIFGSFDFYSCAFAPGANASAKLQVGAYGYMNFYGQGDFNIANTVALNGIESTTNRLQNFNAYSVWQTHNTLTATRNGATRTTNFTTRTQSITTNGINGAMVFPIDAAANNGQRQAIDQTLVPVYKVTFTLSNIVGGAGTIAAGLEKPSGAINAFTGSPFAAGTYTIYMKSLGDGNGVVRFNGNGTTSFDISNMSLEMM